MIITGMISGERKIDSRNINFFNTFFRSRIILFLMIRVPFLTERLTMLFPTSLSIVDSPF